MRGRTKIIIAAAVVVVIAGAIGVIQSRKAKGIRVRTAKVERKNLVQLVTANGTVQAKTKVELSANIMGQITRLNVEEGDHVKKGDLLLVIDQARYASAVASARSNLQALQAQLTAFDEQLAVLERIIVPLADWSKTWADLEQRLMTLRRGSDPEGRDDDAAG